MKIYILGAGTLGRFIIDIIESQDGFEIGGVFDDGYPKLDNIYGYPIIGKLNDVDINIATNLAVGIGEPKWRKKIFEEKDTPNLYGSTYAHNYSKLKDAILFSEEFSEPIKDTAPQFGVEITRIDGPWNHSTVGTIKKVAERKKGRYGLTIFSCWVLLYLI